MALLKLDLPYTCNSMNNLSSYCGLIDSRMSASEKDLPVLTLVAGEDVVHMAAGI